MRSLFIFLMLVPSAVYATEPIVGLVQIPALHRQEVGGGERSPPVGPAVLFGAPALEAEIAVIVRDLRELEWRELSYEEAGAAVYQRERNPGGGYWYRLAYADGDEQRFAWLNQSAAGEYYSIESLVSSKMTYLTAAWDHRVYERPTAGAASQMYDNLGKRPDIRVAGSQLVDGELWFLVVIVNGSICRGDRSEVLASGWVPAHSESGDATVWYYSRGC